MAIKETRFLKSHPCVVYDTLHEIEEFEAFREQAKAYFAKKYGIDYLCMHIINKDRNMIFYRMDQEKWHEWVIHNKLDLFYYPVLLNRMDSLKPNEIYIEYFDSWMMTDATRIRAEIFGERKYGGCDVLMTNENNDIISYHITFKDDKSFGVLPEPVLNELINDLIKYRNLLTPFVRYGEIGRDFTDKISLNKYLDKFKMENRSLFVM